MPFRQMSELMISSLLLKQIYHSMMLFEAMWNKFLETLQQSDVQGNLVWGVDPFLSILPRPCLN